MMTRPEYHDVLARLLKVRSESRLTNAALETLAVVAYRQPIIRADIESVRGVACGDMLRKLMDKNLVKIVGRAEVLGRPMLYGTTRHFLEVFGLNSLDDLPNVEQLRAPARPQETDQAQTPGDQADQTGGESPDAAPAEDTAVLGEYRSESPAVDADAGEPPGPDGAESDAETSDD
jgi:segregation and condensation protein B